MNFFDQATADLSTMHNVDEFARLLSINNPGETSATAVACILDEELATPSGTSDGVREWDATLYVPVASMPAEPVIDQRLDLIGDSIGGTRPVVVVHTNTIHGERVIRLRWFDS